LRSVASLHDQAWVILLSVVGRAFEIMRTKGSCRFAAYYKVQVWNDRQLSWSDIQKQHPTEDQARNHFINGAKCRVMMVTENGREPLP
jgi:hypothetical protein